MSDPQATILTTLPLDGMRTHRISFTYTNWRGETALRHVVPVGVEFGSTKWHPEPGWLLRARDTEKRLEERLFAMKDMTDVTAA